MPKWPSPIPEYINSLRDINNYKEQLLGIFQQEFPMSNFFTRLKEAINPYSKEREHRGNGLLGQLQRQGKDNTYVRVRFRDLEDILSQYEYMNNVLRTIHIDADLRSEPTIINMPNSIEKEEYIRDNPQALF